MTGKIFISYRREDASGDARSIEQHLRQALGKQHVFFDIDSIERGKDFRVTLRDYLERTKVLLAIMGPSWIALTDGEGKRRLDDPADYVRMEIGSALRSNIRVIPVLIQGARMPYAEDLPEDIREIAFRQAANITHSNFSSDVGALERDIRNILGLSPPETAHVSRAQNGALAISIMLSLIGGVLLAFAMQAFVLLGMVVNFYVSFAAGLVLAAGPRQSIPRLLATAVLPAAALPLGTVLFYCLRVTANILAGYELPYIVLGFSARPLEIGRDNLAMIATFLGLAFANSYIFIALFAAGAFSLLSQIENHGRRLIASLSVSLLVVPGALAALELVRPGTLAEAIGKLMQLADYQHRAISF
jgi:hypothetical protein